MIPTPMPETKKNNDGMLAKPEVTEMTGWELMERALERGELVTINPQKLADLEAAEIALAECTASHQRTNTKLAEAEADSELLDWMIDRLNNAEDIEDLWDLCPGTSDDVHEEFRAAIRAARGKKQ